MGWSEEDKAKIVALYASGLSASEIARDYFPDNSRNSIVGVIARERNKNPHSVCLEQTALWSDRQSLRLLWLKECENLHWAVIASQLRKTKNQCTAHYREIMRDLEESERA